jgi:chromate transporter
MAPLTLGLLLATGWVLTAPVRDHWGAMLLVPLTALLLVKTRLSPVWLVAMGALAGALGWA